MSSVMGMRGEVAAQAVSEALAAIRVGGPGDLLDQAAAAARVLGSVPASDDALPAAALACVEAAREHLRYGELLEARTLLTEAGVLLLRHTVVIPSPATRTPSGTSVGGEVMA